MDSDNQIVLEADIPMHMRHSGSSQVQVVLTQSRDGKPYEIESRSSNSSTNTLQVPDFSSTERLDMRRRSLNSLLQENQNRSNYGNRRSSAPPNRRASCGWGPVWELRKQFARHKRRLSSDDYQVICQC